MSDLSEKEIDRLVSLLIDGVISAADHRLLQDELLASREARERYIKLLAVHNLLELLAEAPKTVSIPDPLTIKGPGNQPLARRPFFGRSIPVPIHQSSAAASRPGIRRLPQRFGRAIRRNRASLLGTAAILALAAFLAWKWIPPLPAARLVASGGSVFALQHPADLRSAPANGTLVPGSSVELKQGTVELTFSSGVRGVFQAPETITLSNDKQVTLRRGAAWFHVPPRAIGFEVVTPELKIVDLGTEFGVVSRADGADEIHVFTGKVQAETRKGKAAKEILEVGESCSVSPDGGLEKIESRSSLFQTDLADTPYSVHWTFDDQTVAASGNLPAAGLIKSRMVSSNHATSFETTPGMFGRALSSLGNKGYIETDWQGIDGVSPRTVAYWLKIAPGQTCLNPIVGWGARDLFRSFFTYIRSTPRGVVSAVSCDTLWLEGSTPIDDSNWHHIAVVYTGRSLSTGDPEILCYVDGVPDRMTRNTSENPPKDSKGAIIFDTVTSGPAAIPLTLFTDMYSDRRMPEPSPRLSIDELFVIQSALSEQQIGHLIRQNECPPPDPGVGKAE